MYINWRKNWKNIDQQIFENNIKAVSFPPKEYVLLPVLLQIVLPIASYEVNIVKTV